MKALTGIILAPFFPYILLIAFVFSQFDYHSRSFEYVGKEHSNEIIAEIMDETNLKIPEGSIGLAYKYFPPIDPMYFAKVQLSEDGKNEFIDNLGEICYYKDFPNDFASDRCDWWKFNTENLIFSKIGILEGYFIEIYILKEDHVYHLYLKKFTI